MKKILIISSLILSFTIAKSQIYFKNNYSEPVWVSYVYYENTRKFDGWISNGWYKVVPGEKKMLLESNPFGRYVYYYAQSMANGKVKKAFDGKSSFLIHPTDGFNIKNADKEYVMKDNPSYKAVKFRKIDKGAGNFAKFKYTIEFNY